LVDFALEHAKKEGLHKLVKYVDADMAILFSNDDAFEIAKFLSENESAAKAKPGQESPEDIEIKAGPTNLMPGPDISALSSVGLQPKVEDGKISIMQDAILVKKGEKINEDKAAILTKLDITPFTIGVEPVAVCMDGKVFADIKINVKETLEKLEESFSRSLAFAVSINYPNKETIGFILAKASSHENSLYGLVKEPESSEEKSEGKVKEKEEQAGESEKKEEDKGESQENESGEEGK